MDGENAESFLCRMFTKKKVAAKYVGEGARAVTRTLKAGKCTEVPKKIAKLAQVGL